MEITIKIKRKLGADIEIVRTFSDIDSSMNMSDIGNLVKDLGSSVLPEIEKGLVHEASKVLDVGGGE